MTKSIINYDENCISCKCYKHVHGHWKNNTCPEHSKKFRCVICNKGYVNKYTLNIHIKKKSCNKNIIHCYWCNRRLKSSNNHNCKYIINIKQDPDIKEDDKILDNTSLKFMITETNFIDRLLFDEVDGLNDFTEYESIYSVKLVH